MPVAFDLNSNLNELNVIISDIYAITLSIF